MTHRAILIVGLAICVGFGYWVGRYLTLFGIVGIWAIVCLQCVVFCVADIRLRLLVSAFLFSMQFVFVYSFMRQAFNAEPKPPVPFWLTFSFGIAAIVPFVLQLVVLAHSAIRFVSAKPVRLLEVLKFAQKQIDENDNPYKPVK